MTPTPLKTLSIVPDVSGRRFGVTGLGYDGMTTVRMEFGALVALAALVVDKPADAITVDDVLQARVALEEGRWTVSRS